MNDDALLDRLRRAAADVPPSTLDLEAVLRSARRKRARHRGVVASGCVAAVAGVGAVVPAVPGLLPPEPVSDVAAAALGGGCPGGPTVDWRTASLHPVISSAHLVTVLPEGELELVEAVRNAAAPELWFPVRARDDVRQAVLAEARKHDERGIPADAELFDSVGTMVLDAEPGDGAVTEAHDPLSGFVAAAEAAPPDGSDRAATALDLEAGTYVLYDQGLQHEAVGAAGCGDDRGSFTLTFAEPASTGVVDCARTTASTLDWALKESLCPDGATATDRRSVGMTADVAPDVLSTLGLPTGG